MRSESPLFSLAPSLVIGCYKAIPLFQRLTYARTSDRFNRWRYFGTGLPKTFPRPVHASRPRPTGVPTTWNGTAASTANTVAKANARPAESFFRCLCMRYVGTNVATKQPGIANNQTGGTQSKIAQRLSTATSTSAESAWIGAPSECGVEEDGAGGTTSSGTSFAGSSLNFGGASIL